MQEANNKITINDENGKEVVYNILFKHYAPEFGKTFVVFVEEGTNNASAATVVKKENGEGLEEITSQEEWTLLEGLLDEYVTQQRAAEGASCGGSCGGCSGCSSPDDFDDDDFEDEEEGSCSCGDSCGCN